MIAYYKYLIGGALVGALLITSYVFDYGQSLEAQLPGIQGVGDTSDNIIVDLGDVDKNDNSELLVTDGDNGGVTLNQTMMSPTLSPLPKVSPSSTPKISSSPSVSPDASPVPKLSTDKTSGKIIINEIAWAGTKASPTDEWLELYNAENEPIDISGWRLVAEDGSMDITFQEGTVIGAKSYFLIERTDDNAISGLTADLVASFGNGLHNDGEVLWLINAGGIPVDSVGKTGEKWPAGDATAKLSMERNGMDWMSFSGTPMSHDEKGNPIHGTPKTTNSEPPTSTPTPTPTSTPTPLPSPTATPTPSPTPLPTPTPTPEPTPTPSPTPSPTPVPVEKININTDGYEKLQEITGVGPVIAQRIIDYRQINGPFQTIEDIKNVSGIGDAKFEVMKDEITVGDI